VGQVFLARGDVQTANDFRRPNLIRTQMWLQKPATTSLVSTDSPGTLEERGAAWMLVRYLTEHYGGNTLLGRLTANTAAGVANVTSSTGRAWPELLAEFALAVWADRAPELSGTTVEPHLTLGSFDLRTELVRLTNGFPLNPVVIGGQDLLESDALVAAAQDYLIVQTPAATSARLSIAFTGLRGGPFAAYGAPQLMLLRLR
jgi:hypothetical protein